MGVVEITFGKYSEKINTIYWENTDMSKMDLQRRPSVDSFRSIQRLESQYLYGLESNGISWGLEEYFELIRIAVDNISYFMDSGAIYRQINSKPLF